MSTIRDMLIQIRNESQRTDNDVTSVQRPWNGQLRQWECGKCGNSEKRPLNVHAAVCSECHKQMKLAAS